MSRDTPQSSAIPPALWSIVMDKILWLLDKSLMEAVLYANDLVIFVSGMFLSIMTDIMEGTLGNVCLWDARRDSA